MTIAADHRSPMSPTGDPFGDPRQWIAGNERITNTADLDAWMALYAPEAVLETVTSGAFERAEGIEAIRPVAAAIVDVGRRCRLKVEKRFVAADDGVIVNTWSGGFGGRDRQFGSEIWTLRDDGLAVHHEMYTFMDVRPSTHPVAALRALAGGEVAVMARLGMRRARLALSRVA